MKLMFFCEHGEIIEIGTGHKYRTQALAGELRLRGHQIVDNLEDCEVLVIDHLMSQTERILEAKARGVKVVLIDGTESDARLADLTISAFFNKAASYAGLDYMAFPVRFDVEPYDPEIKSDWVFVGMGGFDAGNLAEAAIQTIRWSGMRALVAKSINHPDWSEKYRHVTMFEGSDYYDALSQCVAGITAGGLTLFQALQFGLPCVAIPQYEHQAENISNVDWCCIPATTKDLVPKFSQLLNKSKREQLSSAARFSVDGKAIRRICDLIEGLQ